MTEIRIYYEGDKCLGPGFRAFFGEMADRARLNRCKFDLISTGATAKRDFGIAIRSHKDAWNILLLDSEGPDTGNLAARLSSDQGWPYAHRDSIFWMVEMMESWFHADKDALHRFYQDGFNARAMAANQNVEQISKKDLMDGLKAATRCTRKGAYHKTKHAPRLLEVIDPGLVRRAAPNCDRLFVAILDGLADNHQPGD
jgi:Domain of unknown function (DUF4276)